MYLHIKAVTYVTFPNKQDFLPKLIRQNTRGNVKQVYILVVCPYSGCNVLPCQLNMALYHMFVEKCRKKPSLPCEKRITKTQEL